ncbi:MAG: FapA family protein [Lachnospiraceae bacterium]|nr:FapA family protein [Lachnospiraceae bacterium]
MAQASTTTDIKALFSKAGLDYDKVRAQGFDSWQLAEIQRGLEAGISVTDYLDPEMPWTEMEEYRLELEQGFDLSSYREKGFTTDRLAQIREGLAQKLDVSQYAKPEYFAEQMKEIREGLAQNLPIMFYKDPAYNYMQMAEIRRGLEQNVDISKFAKTDMPYRKMRAIREALAEGIVLDDYVYDRYQAGVITELAWAKKSGVDILSYAEEGYDAEQLLEIRHALEAHQTEFIKYINKQYRGESLKEIRIGIREGLDVSHYASIEYSWKQMREIRLGLEARVNTKIYEKPLYRPEQMREIRLGLEAGVDVNYYTSMVYSSREMRLRRHAIEAVLKKKGEQEDVQSALSSVGQGVNTSTHVENKEMSDEEKAKSGIPFVAVSPDGLKAEVYLPYKIGKTKEYTMEVVTELLAGSKVIYGIDYTAIAEMIEKKHYNRRVVVAKGLPAQAGKDGRYEYFFDTAVPSQPIALPDSSLNYETIKFYEMVTVGKKLAEYHEAEYGTEGRTVLGEKIPAIKGKEYPILKGRGIMMMEDKKSWCATLSGEIRLNDFEITIRQVDTIDEAKGPQKNFEYVGSVIVKGNVHHDVVIKAGGDIIVQGKIDGADLIAEGNVCVVGGCLGTQKRSTIKSGGRVTASTIRNTDIRARKSIWTNNCTDSDLIAGGKVNVAGARGTIDGGEIQAEKGIRCAILGRPGGRTLVQLGATNELTAQYSICLKNLARVESELTLIRSERDRLAHMPNNAIKTQNQIKVGQALSLKETEENDLNEERQSLEKRLQEITGATARVTRVAHSGTIITIDGVAKQLTDDMSYPKGIVFRKDRKMILAVEAE